MEAAGKAMLFQEGGTALEKSGSDRCATLVRRSALDERALAFACLYLLRVSGPSLNGNHLLPNLATPPRRALNLLHKEQWVQHTPRLTVVGGFVLSLGAFGKASPRVGDALP